MKILNLLTCCVVILLCACHPKNPPHADIQKTDSEANVDNAADRSVRQTVEEIPTTVEQPIAKIKTTATIYPKELVQLISNAQNDCQNPIQIKMQDVVKVVDLIAGQQPEYIYEPDQIYCPEDGVFRGHGGNQLVIYQLDPHNKLKEIFNGAVFGYQIFQQDGKATVNIEVGGAYCGQDMQQISRSEALYCQRNLEWDQQSKQLKMGEIQHITKNSNS